MTIYSFEDRIPKIGKNTYVAETAKVIGDVTIGDNCFISFGAVLRGDYGSIEIGNSTSIQENCIIHARPDEKTIIGNNVTVGHGAIIHGAVIKDNVIIGMGAIVSDYSTINSWSIIAEGALIKTKQEVEPESIMVGLPGVLKRKVTEEQKEYIKWSSKLYADMAHRYLKNLKKL